jgi:hypothetical protein
VVSERNGTWGKALVVPGIVKLDGDGNSEVEAVACPRAANRCSAGGYYEHNHMVSMYGFIVAER